MPQLQIQVTNKKATYMERGGDIVCGNGDYSVLFTFDAEWDGVPDKVARFIWNGQYFDAAIDENGVASVPVIRGAAYVLVGVYSETMHTTTSASIPCSPSILCASDQPDPGHGQSYSEQAKAAAVQADEAAQRAEDAAKRAETASITIDTELSDTSENPVQNKAVAAALQQLQGAATEAMQALGEQQQQTAGALQQLSEDATEALQAINAKQQQTDEALGEITEQLGQADPVPVSIDLSALETEGKIVETYADGSTKTSTMEFDADGNPTKITDGDGNVTTLTW